MVDPLQERLVDDLLAKAFAIEDRPIDVAFSSLVEARVAELERYRAWRRRFRRRLSIQIASIGALAGAAGLISMNSEQAIQSVQEPTLVWAGMLIMLLCWLALVGKPSHLGSPGGASSSKLAMA